MLLLILLRLAAFLMLAGGFGWAVHAAYQRAQYNKPLPIKPGLIVGFLGILALGFTLSATHIPGTHMAVVENTATGSFSTIGPGIHVWPFEPALIPFASNVTKYKVTERERIEIGDEEPAEGQKQGIQADSDSPGRPVVFIQARGWAVPNPQRLIELHKQYGPTYLDTWVERNWLTAIKSVQGQHAFDYLGNNRDKMASEIEAELQEELTVDGEPLVFVSQLAITNFDFEDNINTLLRQVSEKEFERQKAEEERDIALRLQEAEEVRADTRLKVAQKDAEAAVAKARGDAESIRLQEQAIQQSQGYLIWQWILKWNGILPQFATGEQGLIPFLNIPFPE